ncbi:glycosyltransferase family 8 protein [Lacticaseibacillus porcinae]|uniref:glycosyltransferase family 8 protein n=1 Tax=Lacticaseibacillus porcinae TaxID=1123687 RepID=UPI000F7BAA48|nr:glycosyltransferase family 8 protein [Lacticaseibacillus porcinae]
MIPVFYSIDDHYAAPFAVSLQSLQAHAHDPRGYQVIVLAQNLSQSTRDTLMAMITNPLVHLEFVTIDADTLAQIDDTGNKLRCDYFTFTIYLRLFIPQLFKSLKKAVYLDADTLILEDVAKLYDHHLAQHLVGAVSDPFIANDPVTNRYARVAIGVPAEHYLNSGVLVMNLAAMRTVDFTDHFLSLLHTYHFQSLAPDQDYLNAIVQQRVLWLDSSWNRQGDAGLAQIVHFNLFAKPWHYTNVAYQDAFWYYADLTPFAQTLHAQLTNYDQQAADQVHMQALVDSADRIAQLETTFANIRDAGVAVAL